METNKSESNFQFKMAIFSGRHMIKAKIRIFLNLNPKNGGDDRFDDYVLDVIFPTFTELIYLAFPVW